MFSNSNRIGPNRSLGLFCALFLICVVGAAESQSLVLTIELGKSAVVLGEPIYLMATVENPSSGDAMVFPSLYPEDGALRVFVTGGGAAEAAFVPYSLDLTDMTPQPLGPGKEFSAAFPIFFGARGWTIRKPGSYQVNAVLVDPASGKTVVQSASVELTVSAGEGAGQYLVGEGKASEEAGLFLLWQQGDHLRAGLAHLKGLVEQYPASPVVDYARLALARNLSQPFHDYSIGKLREPDPEAARQYLQKVDAKRLPAYLQVDQMVTESRIQSLLGDKEGAGAALERARPLVEEQPALRPLLEPPAPPD